MEPGPRFVLFLGTPPSLPDPSSGDPVPPRDGGCTTQKTLGGSRPPVPDPDEIVNSPRPRNRTQRRHVNPSFWFSPLVVPWQSLGSVRDPEARNRGRGPVLIRDGPSGRPDSLRSALPTLRPPVPTLRPPTPILRPLTPTRRLPTPTLRPPTPTLPPPTPTRRPPVPTRRPPVPTLPSVEVPGDGHGPGHPRRPPTRRGGYPRSRTTPTPSTPGRAVSGRGSGEGSPRK